MTLCAEQDDEIIINPDTNHNHQPLLSVDTNTKQRFDEDSQLLEDTKDSSTVNEKRLKIDHVIFNSFGWIFNSITVQMKYSLGHW
jgi:hypothetical protein